MRMVHPDDRAAVEAESDAFLAGQGGDLTDYRMVRPDGRVVWIRDRAYADRNDEGRVVWEQGILFDITELKDAEARVAHMAFHDGLTGLANRQLFEETLELALERARRDRSVVAVLFLDLDNFKQVNDTLGHHAGDRLLMEVAQQLRDCTRGTDLVARQGGDEFLILLADLETSDAAPALTALADRIQRALAQPFRLYGIDIAPSASIGISQFPGDAYDAETLLKNADIVMYRAKREGPGRHVLHVGTDLGRDPLIGRRYDVPAMAYDEELAERVRVALADVKGVNEIKMFGGLCYTVGGNMAVGVIREDLLVRLSPEDGDAALAEPDVRLMEIGSRSSRGFLSVAPEATSTDRKLQAWVDRGVAFASSLPPKKPKPKKPKS